MSAIDEATMGYEVPSYRVADDAPWYHFLHGNVPGHQIDFMYRPEVPQGPLTRQHFSHLSRLMKYIEPQTGSPFAFAIGNLSRDDTQHVPGHGGVAIIFGLRIQGATDHAGRQDPPFTHAIAAIDRELGGEAILSAARAFHRQVLGAVESAEWYRSYVRCATTAPAEVSAIFADYVAAFDHLAAPPVSDLALEWVTGGAAQPRRIVLVHKDDAPFEDIAACAAKIAAVLYRSDVRWSAISSGREADLPNGVSIRLIAASSLTAADAALGPRRIEDVPADAAGIAQQLFGATPIAVDKPQVLGWRDRYAEAAPEAFTPEGAAVDGARPSWEAPAPSIHQRSNRPPPGPALHAREPLAHRATEPHTEAATPPWERSARASGAVDIDVDQSSLEGEEASPGSRPGERVPLPTPAAVMPLQQARSGAPPPAPVVPPVPPLPPACETSSTLAPLPDFRRSSMNPLLRWTLILMAFAGALILAFYLLVPRPSESQPAVPSTPAPPVSAASSAITPPAPTVPVVPSAIAKAATTKDATVSPAASAALAPVKPGKPSNRPTKPGSVFGGPLQK